MQRKLQRAIQGLGEEGLSSSTRAGLSESRRDTKSEWGRGTKEGGSI